MKVEIKLFSALRQGRDKKMIMNLEPGATPTVVICNLKIKPAQVAIIMVNGIPAAVDTRLNDGDVISLLPAIGGG